MKLNESRRVTFSSLGGQQSRQQTKHTYLYSDLLHWLKFKKKVPLISFCVNLNSNQRWGSQRSQINTQNVLTQTQTQTDRQTHTHTHRQTDTHTCSDINKVIQITIGRQLWWHHRVTQNTLVKILDGEQSHRQLDTLRQRAEYSNNHWESRGLTQTVIHRTPW